jgi:hypothetical protein
LIFGVIVSSRIGTADFLSFVYVVWDLLAPPCPICMVTTRNRSSERASSVETAARPPPACASRDVCGLRGLTRNPSLSHSDTGACMSPARACIFPKRCCVSGVGTREGNRFLAQRPSLYISAAAFHHFILTCACGHRAHRSAFTAHARNT